MSVAGAALVNALERLPSAALSRAFGTLSDLRLPPPIQAIVNRGFAYGAGIDLSESERPPEAYASLNEFFTRALRPGVHTIDEGGLVSPVDGRLSEYGRIENGTLVQAKGCTYGLADLLRGDPDLGRYSLAHYFTLYLSPRDYHRIHSPVSGHVTSMAYVPGVLLPVNRHGVSNVDGLFVRNERLTSTVETDGGELVAVVKVGATCVGRIGVVYDDFVSNVQSQASFRREYGESVPIGVGDELGRFNLGSTVVLIVSGEFSPEPGLRVGQSIRLGRRLGSWH